jgi:predicted nucleic acid-binding protein
MSVTADPRILPRPLSVADAAANVSALLALGHVRSPGEADGFWPLFQATAAGAARGNLVFDAHIATLMRQHGVGTIYTRERDFRRFYGIRVEDPF